MDTLERVNLDTDGYEGHARIVVDENGHVIVLGASICLAMQRNLLQGI